MKIFKEPFSHTHSFLSLHIDSIWSLPEWLKKKKTDLIALRLILELTPILYTHTQHE